MHINTAGRLLPVSPRRTASLHLRIAASALSSNQLGVSQHVTPWPLHKMAGSTQKLISAQGCSASGEKHLKWFIFSLPSLKIISPLMAGLSGQRWWPLWRRDKIALPFYRRIRLLHSKKKLIQWCRKNSPLSVHSPEQNDTGVYLFMYLAVAVVV